MTRYQFSSRPLFFIGLSWLLLAVIIVVYQLATPPAVEIAWVTATEFDTAGFNLYRSEQANGEFVQINTQLIASQADPATGATYRYLDEDVVPGTVYYYQLEDVEYNNTRRRHDMITGQATRIENWAVILAAASGLIGVALILFGSKPKRVS